MTVHLACLIAGCEWPADPAASSGDQYRALTAHYQTHHFQRKSVTVTELSQVVPNRQIGQGWDGGDGHPGASSPSVAAALEAELDRYVKIALEWPKPEGGPFDSMPIKILENELEKTKSTAVGRGIAIALAYMRGPQHHSPDSIINEAVARYRERQAPTHLQAELGAQQLPDEAQQQLPPTSPSPAAMPSPVPPAAPVSSPAPTAPPAPPTAPTPPPVPVTPMPPAPPVQPVAPAPIVEAPQAPAAPSSPTAPVVQLPTAAPQPVQQVPVAAPPVQAAPEWGSTGPTSTPPAPPAEDPAVSFTAAMGSGGQVVQHVAQPNEVPPGPPTGPSAADAAASFASALASGHQQVQVEQPGPPPIAPPAFAGTTAVAAPEPGVYDQMVDGTAEVAAAQPDPEIELRNDRIREALAAGMSPEALSQMMGIPVAEIEALR